MNRPRDHRAVFIDDRISDFLRQSHESMLRAARLKAHTRILVTECRDGWAAEEACRRVLRGYVCGVDVSHDMVTLARRYREIEGRLEFAVWDRASLPFEDAAFDLVLIPFSVHRFPKPRDVIREVVRVLRPDGRALVLESTRYSFLGLYALVDHFYRAWDPAHERYYTTAQLMTMANATLIECSVRRGAVGPTG